MASTYWWATPASLFHQRIQRILQLDVERAGTETTPAHWTENLDVAYRVEPEGRVAAIDEVRFARDSPLEEGGFEPPVPTCA
jgi:hypothetical protein